MKEIIKKGLVPAMPEGIKRAFKKLLFRVGGLGENGSSTEPRLMPDEVILLLRFGYPKSKEKPLRMDKNGNVLSMSLTATRRISEETVPFFEGLF